MIARGPVTQAMDQLITTATGKACGVITVPMVGDVPVPPPYYILAPLPMEVYGPPLADDNADATVVYQVTCVSGPNPDDPESRGGSQQAEWLADKVRTAILGRHPVTRQWLNALTIPGVSCTARRVDTEPGATNEPQDAIINYVIRFALDLTPA